MAPVPDYDYDTAILAAATGVNDRHQPASGHLLYALATMLRQGSLPAGRGWAEGRAAYEGHVSFANRLGRLEEAGLLTSTGPSHGGRNHDRFWRVTDAGEDQARESGLLALARLLCSYLPLASPDRVADYEQVRRDLCAQLDLHPGLTPIERARAYRHELQEQFAATPELGVAQDLGPRYLAVTDVILRGEGLLPAPPY